MYRLLVGVPLVVVGTGGVAIWITKKLMHQSRVPRDFPQKKELRSFLYIIRMVKLLSAWGERLGLGHRVHLMRRLFDWYGGDEPELMSDENLKVEYVKFGEISVKLYIPVSKTDGLRPGMVYYHGGGWVLGSAAEMDGVTRQIATQAGMVVASVDYRMSPEFLFPIPFNDCVEATKYFLEHTADYGVDGSRVCAAGDSAGGQLAAAVSLKLRNENYERKLKMQVLIYPCLQAVSLETSSYKINHDDPYLDRDFMIEFLLWYAIGKIPNKMLPYQSKGVCNDKVELQQYFDVQSELRTEAQQLNVSGVVKGNPTQWQKVKDIFTDVYFSPLLADDMSGLPHTYIITCEQDVLRDEGMIYNARLREAGVQSTRKHYNCLHALLDTIDLEYAQLMMTDMIEYLKQNL